MCKNQRALISKVKIADNGTTHVYYSFSPTRAKFWMGFVIAAITIAGMLLAIKVGAENAVETFVKSKCAEYLAQFHEEVRPQLDAARATDIAEAVAVHSMATGAEYSEAYHNIEKEQTAAISEIRIEQAAQGATLQQMQVNEEHQTRMLEELVRKIK